jgi:hypothetical protein
VSDEEFDFKITKRSIFTKIAKAFGKTYALTGDGAFDEKFAIASQNEQLIKKIFAKNELKELFYNEKRINFTVKKAKGKKDTRYVENEKELYYNTGGVIKDNERLMILFGLFIFLLDAFEEYGIAKSERPKISY